MSIKCYIHNNHPLYSRQRNADKCYNEQAIRPALQDLFPDLRRGLLMRQESQTAAPVNPYHYIVHCIGGKWKMTILHEIHTFGNIRFSRTLKQIPISEKILSQQLQEMVKDGIVRRISYDTVPPKTEYVLTEKGAELIPMLDMLYIWSIKKMQQDGIPIDIDNFVVHTSDHYVDAIGDVMEAYAFSPRNAHHRNTKVKPHS